MSLKYKLTALVAISLSLVVTTACMKSKSKDGKLKDKMQEACNQVQRVCKDGTNAVRDSENSCYQKCPEDPVTMTNTSTTTQTQTQTQTQTSTVTSTASQTQ